MDTKPQTITITVDGAPVECAPGELLIAAAERAGIYIPRFCWHKRMDPVGACRMCLVDVEGSPPIPGTDRRRPQTACTTVVRDGMVAYTQFSSPEVNHAQKAILELLLINHPLDCPICDRGGECPLQDQTLDYGPAESRYTEPKRRFVKPVEISPLVNLDRERCILCYRCTRFCEEVSGDTMITTMERGPRAYIYPFPGDIFDSYFSGNTVQICPVGALTSRPYRFQARPWDLNVQANTCNLCASGCAITTDVRISDGKLARVSAATNEDVNEEWLCDKGRYGHGYVSSTQRLTHPLVRTEEGLVQASWDDVFRILGEWVPKLSEDPSRAAVITGQNLADEDAYVAQKFARLVLGTNNVDSRLEGGMSGDAALPPQLTYDDLLASDLVVLVSADLREELPLVYLRLRVAASKGRVALAVVHSRRVALTELARLHVGHLPGRDAAVGAGVAAALGQPVAAGAEVLAAAAGVSPAELRELADAIRAAERPIVLLGPGALGDPQTLRAWSAVAAAGGARLGWAPRRSGEYGALAAGAHPTLLPGWRRIEDPAARADVEGLWGAAPPEAAGLDVPGVLGRARDGGLDLLWVVGADLLRDVPDATLGEAGLRGARFVVVQDVARTPQADIAHLVLPAAAFAERDGTLTNWEGRRQTIRAAVDPPGAARGDYAILGETARRLGRPIGCGTIDDASRELETLLDSVPRSADVDRTLVSVTESRADPERPLRLLTYRLLYDDGSRAARTEGIRAMTTEAFVELHPSDAAAAGVDAGDPVRVTSAHGEIRAVARVDGATRPGVAFVPFLQPGASARPLITWDDRAPGVRVERA